MTTTSGMTSICQTVAPDKTNNLSRKLIHFLSLMTLATLKPIPEVDKVTNTSVSISQEVCAPKKTIANTSICYLDTVIV